MRGLRALRHRLPGRLHRRRGGREHAGAPALALRAVCEALRDQPAALHLLRDVRRSLSLRRHHHGATLRPGRRPPRQVHRGQRGHAGATERQRQRHRRAVRCAVGPTGRPQVVVAFAILAAWELVTAAGVVAFRRPIYNALALVANMLGLAVLFLILNAQFLFAAQVIVYAGAVMVLFVFIIALMNPESDVALPRRGSEWIYGAVFGVIFAALLVSLLFNRGLTGRPGTLTPEAIAAVGNVQTVGIALYTRFLFPVEVTSLLLLIAAVGAVYLAMRRIR